MADRLSLFPEEDNAGLPSLFSFSGQRTVDRETYQTQNVNYYTTALGLPTLEEESGIEVDVPEDITELATPGQSPEKDDGDDTPRVLEPMSIVTKDTIEGGEIKFSEDAMTGAGFSFSSKSTPFDSYSDYLKDAGFKDRINFAENILEPLLDPNKSIKDLKIGSAAAEKAKTSVEKIGEGIKETPSRFERLIDGKLTAQDSAALAKGLMTTAGPAGLAAGMFIGGKTIQNAFGKSSFMPNGLLGGIADVVHTLQFRDMAANRALKNSLGGGFDDAGVSFNNVDVGFEMLMGNMGITRGHGSGTYSGNMQGLSHEQVKSLEAVSKGYDPRGYNMFEPTKSRSNVVADGGMFVSDNPLDGFFRGNGTYYDPRRFSSGVYSTEATSKQAAASVGLSHTQFKDALAQARAGDKTLSEAIADIKAGMTASTTVAPEPVVTTSDDRDDSGPPTFTTGGKQYEIGTGAGQVDPGLAAAVQREAFGNGSQQSSSPSKSEGSFGSGGFEDSGRFRARGGLVGYAPGGAVARGGSGFINRPPEQVSEAESVADNQQDAVPEGTFIINAAAVEFAGSDDIRKMLVTAHKEAIRRGITVDKSGKGAKLIDVALSSGEVKVAPYLAKIIGYDRLEKINNRGKREVEERIRENGQQQVGAAEGGFIPLPERSPVRKKKEEMTQFADQELRNDLDVYLRDNPIAQLGYEVVRSGAYEIRAGYLKEGQTSTLGGFTGSEGDSAKALEKLIPLSRRTDRPIDKEKGYVFYYAGPNTQTIKTEEGFLRTREEPRTDTDMRILAHELGHVGMRFIEMYKNAASDGMFGTFDYDTEEYMMRLGDEVVRERNNLPHTKFSLTDPIRNAASMFTTGKPARYFEKKGTPVYKVYENMWLKNSDEARKILEQHFDFVPEVKKPKKTYKQKFKEFFGFKDKN